MLQDAWLRQGQKSPIGIVVKAIMCSYFKAVDGGHEELVNDLLVAGAIPNGLSGKTNRTPLHVAAQSGSNGVVSTLVAAGPKRCTDKSFDSPLMKAAAAGHLAVVETLLAAGAHVGLPEYRLTQRST